MRAQVQASFPFAVNSSYVKMSAISYLNNRYLGNKCSPRTKNSDLGLNIDFLISRFACHREDIYTIRGEECDVPPFACKFRKDSECHLLAVANEDGDILLYNTNKKASSALLQSFAAHQNAIFDLCWLPDKCQLISGSGDSHAVLWDMSHSKLISSFEKHNASIKSVDICPQQSSVFVTGSRDGSINIWDTRDSSASICHKPSIHICHAHCRKNVVVKGKKITAPTSNSLSSVSAVAFQDSFNLASAGVADGIVKIWDLRKTYISSPKYLPLPKYRMEHTESKGCTSLVFDSVYKYLYGCSTGSKIFKFNCHSYKKEAAVYEGFWCSTYFVKLAISKDDQYLLCGSSDDKAYIWNTSKPGLPIVQMHGHASEVTSVAWNPKDITKLATCGDDNKVALWKISNLEGIDKNLIHATAEIYTENSRFSNPPNTEPHSETHIISPTTTVKKSPEIVQTPNRTTLRVITNFFSPLTPSPPELTSNFIPSHNSIIQNTSLSSEHVPCSTENKNSEHTTNILKPSNHIKNHTDNLSEKYSSPQLPVGNGSATYSKFSTSHNKENNAVGSSPETSNQTNVLGQTKRKGISNHSTPILKKPQLHSASKSRSHAKKQNRPKAMNGKTITNYFPVISSPED